VAHIFQHMFNRLARRGTSEEWRRRERVREGGNRRMAEEQARREQERRLTSKTWRSRWRRLIITTSTVTDGRSYLLAT
jgi:hypothetical protein